jgi:plasmid stabilization system protein ParE
MDSKNYQVILARRVDGMLLKHVEFLARVSVPAARKFRGEFATLLKRLAENPMQFPVEEGRGLPDGYRSAVFAKRYKALFIIEGHTVYLDAVLDCRQDNSDLTIQH